ncbi:MAG: DUF1302 family protein [Sulfuritalea sp.]|nr:DUF1302 family protein [Sulfuritalea sp.]
MALMAGAPAAFAFEFKSESGEITGSFDTTVSVGALWRVDKRDSTLISIANGGSSRDPNSEDGNLKYDNGELVSTVIKATHDLEVKYQNFGAFVRASYFYDPTIHDKNSLSSQATAELRDKAEILDAYGIGTFDLGGRKLNPALGQAGGELGREHLHPERHQCAQPGQCQPPARRVGAEGRLHPDDDGLRIAGNHRQHVGRTGATHRVEENQD